MLDEILPALVKQVLVRNGGGSKDQPRGDQEFLSLLGDFARQTFREERERIEGWNRALGRYYYSFLSAVPSERSEIGKQGMNTGDMFLRMSLPNEEQLQDGLYYPVNYNSFLLDERKKPGSKIGDFVEAWTEDIRRYNQRLREVDHLTPEQMEQALTFYFRMQIYESPSREGKKWIDGFKRIYHNWEDRRQTPRMQRSRSGKIEIPLTEACLQMTDIDSLMTENAIVFVQALVQAEAEGENLVDSFEINQAQRCAIENILRGVQEAAREDGNSALASSIEEILTKQEVPVIIDG